MVGVALRGSAPDGRKAFDSGRILDGTVLDDRSALDSGNTLDSRSSLNDWSLSVWCAFCLGIVAVLVFALLFPGLGLSSIGVGFGHDSNDASCDPRMQRIDGTSEEFDEK